MTDSERMGDKMRKLVITILAVLITASFAGCKNAESPENAEEPLIPVEKSSITSEDDPDMASADLLAMLEEKTFTLKGDGLQNEDQEILKDFGKSFVNLYHGAVSEGRRVSFDRYIASENLLKFADRSLVLTRKLQMNGGIGINYGLENEFKDALVKKISDDLYYMELPFEYEGSGLSCRMLIKSDKGILKLADFYFGSKDGVDTYATGHSAERKVQDSSLWENEEWVNTVFNKLDAFEEGLGIGVHGEMGEQDGITMTIKEGSLFNGGATVIVRNTLEMEVMFGSYYRLEIKDGDSWVELPYEFDETLVGWEDIGYPVGGNGNESLELQTSWAWLYGTLEKGTYRIVKDYFFGNDYQIKYVAVAEFVID